MDEKLKQLKNFFLHRHDLNLDESALCEIIAVVDRYTRSKTECEIGAPRGIVVVDQDVNITDAVIEALKENVMTVAICGLGPGPTIDMSEPYDAAYLKQLRDNEQEINETLLIEPKLIEKYDISSLLKDEEVKKEKTLNQRGIPDFNQGRLRKRHQRR
jgi:hypothetical protein